MIVVNFTSEQAQIISFLSVQSILEARVTSLHDKIVLVPARVVLAAACFSPWDADFVLTDRPSARHYSFCK